jgi:hypothetical protein
VQPGFNMDAAGKMGGLGGHSYDLVVDFFKLLGEVYPLHLK